MIVRELIQQTDCRAVAHIWNKSYRLDQREPYDEGQLAEALRVHLDILLRFEPVPVPGMILAGPCGPGDGQTMPLHHYRLVEIRDEADFGRGAGSGSPEEIACLARQDLTAHGQVFFGEEVPWPETVQEILGMTVLAENPRNSRSVQALIAAVLHQIFFRNQQKSSRNENRL